RSNAISNRRPNLEGRQSEVDQRKQENVQETKVTEKAEPKKEQNKQNTLNENVQQTKQEVPKTSAEKQVEKDAPRWFKSQYMDIVDKYLSDALKEPNNSNKEIEDFRKAVKDLNEKSKDPKNNSKSLASEHVSLFEQATRLIEHYEQQSDPTMGETQAANYAKLMKDKLEGNNRIQSYMRLSTIEKRELENFNTVAQEKTQASVENKPVTQEKTQAEAEKKPSTLQKANNAKDLKNLSAHTRAQQMRKNMSPEQKQRMIDQMKERRRAESQKNKSNVASM
ncbi:MAG: hypothetical protein K6F99_02570, partial [Lachnospiraceae bacterium]|nr:hypothetical protein [Lachnospiraceae bacterium]